MFIDQVKIEVIAGKGGNGCKSFYKRKGDRYPKPDGGPGGGGADIVIIASSHIQTLRDFKNCPRFRAKNGGHGSSNNKKGKDADSLIIKVSPGTVITQINARYRILADLEKSGDSFIAARGGKGGKGNIHSENATFGQEGEKKKLQLDLKLIAQVGIIGLPNSGKSTLISNISGADSKIADYPFTTKEPILGVVKFDEFSFVAADMPGLIKGAHSGRGLGDRFLRHIERTQLLLHLVDMAQSQDPVLDYESVNQELGLYSDSLARKEQIIVANKMDLPQAARNLERFKARVDKEVFAISAKTRYGLEELVEEIRKRLQEDCS